MRASRYNIKVHQSCVPLSPFKSLPDAFIKVCATGDMRSSYRVETVPATISSAQPVRSARQSSFVSITVVVA
jgi:hypothetical protein